MKNLTKQQMLSLYAATEMQMAVINLLNPKAKGVLVTVEETANFEDCLGYNKNLFDTFCIVVRHVDDFDELVDNKPFDVLPINGAYVYDAVADAVKQGHPSLIDKLFAK